MLKGIGKQPRGESGPAALVLECHERIRRFAALAVAAGARADAAEADVAQACDDAARYFREALPLHVADEEQSILPRLVGRSPALDQALSAMQSEHACHEVRLTALLGALALVRSAPHAPGPRAELAAAATELAHEFAEHLAREEALMVPALRELSAAEQAAIVAEMRARRR